MSSALREWIASGFQVVDIVILIYFFAINTSTLILVVIAAVDFARQFRRGPIAGYDEVYASPLTRPVSVLVPAYNEEAGIVEAVRAMFALRYPQFEIVVIDDGSTDRTFERLREEFDLVEVPRVIPRYVPTKGMVRSVHLARSSLVPLVVVCKENGGKTDALNTGINLAQYPLICMVDADSVLDPQALLAVSKPFSDDPLRVVATGGVVRVANGCRVEAGRVVDVRMPWSWLPAIQVVEYLRAFFLGRAGWSRIGGLLIISGAFGLFRRDVLVEVGGLDPETIGEDAELVVRIHRHMRDRHRDYRIVFVAEPVSWSEVPSSRRVLAHQRRRWHRGITEILIKHRKMIFNPRYGRVGLLALPYYVLFEALSPLVELAGMVMIPLGVGLGIVDPAFLWQFMLIAYGYSMLVSLIALTVEEYSYRRYQNWTDLGIAIVASMAENIGYRQLMAWWRAQGAWAALRRTQHVWGVMTRRGFTTETTSTQGQ